LYSASTAVADDPVEYEQLFRSHRGRILRLCRLLLGDPDDAQDVSQDVFLKLHRALQDQPGDMRWGAWLTAVAVNACRDRQRSWWSRLLRGAEVYDEAQFAGSGLTPEDATLSRETRLHIWKAFRALPARQREVFALRHFEGWSTDEVADLLDISGGSVKQHLFRAVQHLRAALGGSRP
jgi:RNA polymerase sigma-70 factor (ECF subfamily)